uniref:RNase H type-1 domain-containing protein n=1 Tax=Glycine max TaxID=3847 RepID=A0A0R0K8A0_SOYBN
MSKVSSFNKKGSGTGVILESLDEVILEQTLRFKFETTNNQAEYGALLTGLRLAKEVRAKYLRCWRDFKLVTGKLNREYQTKDS